VKEAEEEWKRQVRNWQTCETTYEREGEGWFNAVEFSYWERAREG
jgi:hypothetical protein